MTDQWNALANDTSMSAFQIFFRHASTERNSSYPFISGDTFRALSDHIFDETTDVNKWIDRIWEIGRGDIVFLKSDMLNPFFTNNIFGQIRHPFVLITHNSDVSTPTQEFHWVLNDSKILAWFTQNPDAKHSKLFPIPIGMGNTRWTHGNVNTLQKALHMHRKPFQNRTKLLFVNFQVGTNPTARSKALDWAHRSFNVTQSKLTSFDDYLKDIGNTKFVLSPPGNGLDCHRTWEAMLMGAVPIVLQSHLDPLFYNESIIVVDDWNQLNMSYLQTLNYNGMPSRKVFAKYWYERLLQATGRYEMSKMINVT